MPGYREIRDELEIMGFEPLPDETVTENRALWFVHRGREEVAGIMTLQGGRARVRFQPMDRGDILALCCHQHGLYCARDLAIATGIQRIQTLGLLPRHWRWIPRGEQGGRWTAAWPVGAAARSRPEGDVAIIPRGPAAIRVG